MSATRLCQTNPGSHTDIGVATVEKRLSKVARCAAAYRIAMAKAERGR